ncbi:MAG: hypothetical protein OEM49_14715 [Myxococcales bacterium]|nr:hypothetical protein [Myxococcales bacterium]MDH5308218.1 hypothetical protein [Myxococcales bacterium]MDH5567832.1 hypothetical protein [Myxococcales bacterium]
MSLAAIFALAHYVVPSAETVRLASPESFHRALDESNDLLRTYRYSAFLRQMTPEQLPGAIADLEAHHLWLTPEDLRLFMLAWARFDPAGAFEHVSNWPDNLRELGLGAAVYAWAFYDPSAALEAIEGLESRATQMQLRHELVAGWSARDETQDLSDWIAALPEGQTRQRYTGRFARQLLRRDPEMLLAWADAVPLDAHDGFKKTAVLKAVNALAQQDYLRAKTWIEGHFGQDYARRVAPVVVRNWAKEDAKAALDWSLTLPDEDDRERAVAQAYRAWLKDTPNEATEWLQAHTPADSLDTALRIAFQNALSDSPERAMHWAERIQDPESRARSVREVAVRWKRQDPEALDAWLASAEITDDLRQTILDAPAGKGTPGKRPMVRRPRRRPPAALQGRPDAPPAPAGEAADTP